ncbi:MAG: hypothetical protein ACYC9O_19755 [Candidatus Latescibacterota bacterium]
METFQDERTTRRDVLKKAGKSAAFIAPVLMSFKVSEVKAQNSVIPPNGNTNNHVT